MKESHTNVKTQPACFTCNADDVSRKKKRLKIRTLKRYWTNTLMISAKHSHSSRRSPIFGGIKQLLLSLISTEIAQYLWKVNNCRILKEAWKYLLPTRIPGLNKTVMDKSLLWVRKIEIWYFYSSGTKLWISNMRRSHNVSLWEPAGAVRHNYCCLADRLREKVSPPIHADISYLPQLLPHTAAAAGPA